jgi:PAS domain S-box-containing protein
VSPVTQGRGPSRLAFETRLLDRVNAAVIALDLDGRVLYMNAFAEQLYGWPASEVVGRPADELVGVDVDPAMAGEIYATLERGEAWEGDFELRRRDGGTVTVHATDSAIYDDAGSVAGVVSVAIDVTAQRAETERLAEESRTLRFFLDASTVLTSALEYREALRRLAQVAVPALGDICLIDVEEEGKIQRMAVAHAAPAKQKTVQALLSHSPERQGQHPAVRVLRTGRPELSTEMPDDFLRETTRDDEHFRLVKELGFESYLCVPLPARGRILGTLTIISAGSGRLFGERDLALADDLARRAALVLDNARLLSERSRVAKALQASLLPPQLTPVPGVEAASRYLAAGAGNEVGGDFYDLFGVGYGRWVAVVGDVGGKGPEAAAITGLVRHVLRAEALREGDPAALLQTVNRILLREQPGDEQLCSICCAVLRPRAGRLHATVASAGHPPPVVLRSDGTVAPLDVGGTVLGAIEKPEVEIAKKTLQPGDAIAFYTDGLTEARSPEGEFFGEAGLEAALKGRGAISAQTIVDDLMSAVVEFSGGAPRDDLALLAISVPEGAGAKRPSD